MVDWVAYTRVEYERASRLKVRIMHSLSDIDTFEAELANVTEILAKT